MMDAAEEEEIPFQQRLRPEKKPCVDGESQQHSPALMAAVVSKVLDDDNLLIEILLRVGFPTTLVRAALVCKRWYQHASNREFLRRFRERHPPRLLGFYVDDKPVCSPHQNVPSFIPMLPQPPELATVIRHASFSLDPYWSELCYVIGCWNGRVLITMYGERGFTIGVHSPLHPERGLAVFPPFPNPIVQYSIAWSQLLFKKEVNGLSYIYVWVESNQGRTKSILRVYVLHNGDVVWRRHLYLATDRLSCTRRKPKAVLHDDKIYIPSSWGDIAVLDLMASSISTIQLPQGVAYGNSDIALARVDNALGVYLIHAKELQLHIWLHKGNNWLLVDTICLREMIANLRMSGWEVDDAPTAPLQISHVGNYPEFVFLKMGRCTLHLDIKCRQLRRVHDVTEKQQRFGGDIHPFMMIWPPTFPPLKDDPTRNAI